MPIVNTARESGPERAQEHLVFLDQCRGVAILLVFLNHCTADFTGVPEFWKLFPLRYITQVVNGGFSSPALPEFLGLSPFRIGWPAVAIFFVVSGFCIHLSYCRASRPSLTA